MRIQVALFAAIVLGVAAWAEADTLYGITGGAALVTIDTIVPANATSAAIAGLQPGETIRGLDIRHRDGEIYALTDQHRLYRIDLATPASPQAVPAAMLSSPIGGAALGLDWDPARDRLRVITDTGDNLLVNGDTGEVVTETALTPGSTVGAVTFDTAFFQATSTTLFAVDSSGDRLLRIGNWYSSTSQAGGVVTPVGPLGFDVTGEAGFETRNGASGWLAATLAGAGQSRLYSVDLSSGAMTLAGVIGAGVAMGPVTGLTAPVPPGLRFSATAYSGDEGTTVTVTVERVGSRAHALTGRVYTSGNAFATPGADYVSIDQPITFPAGNGVPQTIAVTLLPDGIIESTESFIVLVTMDGASPVAAYPTVATVSILERLPAGYPTLAVVSPASDGPIPAAEFLTLAGTASDPDGTVVEVSWSLSSGGSGVALGTTRWFIPEMPVPLGTTTITLTVLDDSGIAVSRTMTVDSYCCTFYLAEGALGPFFDTDLAITNPGPETSYVDVTYQTDDGRTVAPGPIVIPARTRHTVHVDQVAGIGDVAISMTVGPYVTTRVVLPFGRPLVERTMRWGSGEQYGAHTEKAVTRRSQTWYFAEGSEGFFYTYLLLQNPDLEANRAVVDWLREGAPPVRRVYTLPRLSRTTIAAGADPELVGQAFGIVVTFDRPGIAERAMYFGTPPDVLWKAGHDSVGAPMPSPTWFLPEGATGSFFTTFVLLANPNAEAANVVLRFLRLGARPIERTVVVPANGRFTLNLGTVPGLENAAVSTEVRSSLPIVAERAQYWPGPPDQWYEAHNAFGLLALGRRWGLAEGRVGNPPPFPPAGYQTYILLANPGAQEARVELAFYREAGRAPVVKTVVVPPASRYNVQVVGPGSAAPGSVTELIDETFGVVISSDVPIAVERAMYANAGAQLWGMGTNATAARLPD